MRILAIGDIVGRVGREYVYRNLNKIRDKYKIDFVVANGENAAETNGINPEIADRLIERGVDVITMGNHTFSCKNGEIAMEDNTRIIRPLNFPPELEGRGYVEVDMGYATVTVINLVGRVGMNPADCPFRAVESALKHITSDIIIVDMHAEATSERLAMGYFLDGKAQIVFGTHTHVQTADEQILPGGTGYISDLGMTGVKDSILGTKKDIVLDFFYKSGKRVKFMKETEGVVRLCGCIFEIDNKTKKVTGVERLSIEGEVKNE